MGLLGEKVADTNLLLFVRWKSRLEKSSNVNKEVSTSALLSIFSVCNRLLK